MCFRYAKISGPKVMKVFVLASEIWVSDPKMTKIDGFFFAYFRIIKLLVEYEDTPATERYFLKLLLVVKYTFCEIKRFCGMSTLDVKFDKNFNILAIFGKNRQFWVRPPYIRRQNRPFSPFGADLFVYLNQIGVQIT